MQVIREECPSFHYNLWEQDAVRRAQTPLLSNIGYKGQFESAPMQQMKREKGPAWRIHRRLKTVVFEGGNF